MPVAEDGSHDVRMGSGRCIRANAEEGQDTEIGEVDGTWKGVNRRAMGVKLIAVVSGGGDYR